MDAQIVIGGQWLAGIAAWGDLAWSFDANGGSKEASWVMTAGYGARLDKIVRGASVTLYAGSVPFWFGYLNEPAWNGNDIQLTAAGAYRRGERYKCFTSTAATTTTSNPTTAIATSNALGNPLGWTIGAGIPNSSLVTGDATDYVNSLTALLDGHAESLNQRWRVDAFGTVSMAADPVTPTFQVMPGVVDLGIADDNYASHVVLRYQNLTGATAVAQYPTLVSAPSDYEKKYDHAEFARDIVDQGPMSSGAATSLAQQIYLRTKQKPGFTSGFEVSSQQLLTMGWQPADLTTFGSTGTVCVQIHGVPDEVALTPYTLMVVGDTSYNDKADTIAINPVNVVSRNQEAVLTEILELLKAMAA